MGDISPELVERAITLVRDMAASGLQGHFAVEARGIASHLPRPVDHDLIEARKIASKINDDEGFSRLARVIRDGARDDGEEVKTALAGIKRGRELAGGAA